MKAPKYTLTNLMLNFIVKYELAMNDLKYNPLPDKYKIALDERFSADDIQKMGELVGVPIGYNKALNIQRGQEMSSEKKKYQIFLNFRSAKDFVKSYTNTNSLKPSTELAVHINRILMRNIVDDWDIGKIRGFSEKPNEIYDTWYKNRDFYPNLDMSSHFNELFDWLQNGTDSNHKLIKIGILLYEFLDKAPFTVGNQITAILVAEILSKKYGYNPNNLVPYFKSIEYISEDILAAHKMTKAKIDLTPFLEAFLYTISVSAIEISKEYISTHVKKVKKQGTLEYELNPRQIQIIDYLTLNQKIDRKMLTKMMGVSFMTSYRDLQDMVQKGYIKAKGQGRGTFYILEKSKFETEDDLIFNVD